MTSSGEWRKSSWPRFVTDKLHRQQFYNQYFFFVTKTGLETNIAAIQVLDGNYRRLKSDSGSLVLIVSFSEELYACEYIEGSLLTQHVYNGLTQVLEESVKALCLQKRHSHYNKARKKWQGTRN